MTQLIEPTATTDQGVPVGVIETDTFCARCGFNLHTQKVWRDERLGILVCRCPECGGHHAVGSESSVGRKWMQRFATIGVMIWVAFGLAFVFGIFAFSCIVYAASSDGLTYHSLETTDGRLVTANWKNTGGYDYTLASDSSVTVDAKDVVDRQRLTPALTGNYPPRDYGGGIYYGQYYAELPQIIIVGGVMTLAWLFCAALLSACCWFWRRGRRWVWLFIPLLTGSVIHEVMRSSQASRTSALGRVLESDVEYQILYVACALQVTVMAIGIYFGRPFARFLLSIFVPPKTRQLFAFLWQCDGKTMPAARTQSEQMAF